MEVEGVDTDQHELMSGGSVCDVLGEAGIDEVVEFSGPVSAGQRGRVVLRYVV